jgi:hypothetical protein
VFDKPGQKEVCDKLHVPAALPLYLVARRLVGPEEVLDIERKRKIPVIAPLSEQLLKPTGTVASCEANGSLDTFCHVYLLVKET